MDMHQNARLTVACRELLVKRILAGRSKFQSARELGCIFHFALLGLVSVVKDTWFLLGLFLSHCSHFIIREPPSETVERPVSTILLLSLSNIFMTFAWYGHLKYGHDWPLWQAILISWFIALFEYCLAVPANRFGFVQFSGFQLKIIQEVITILVFIMFAVFLLKERLAWNYLVAFAFLGVAAFFAFAFKAPGSVI
jgi:uncharacterized protein (DUF486 family)